MRLPLILLLLVLFSSCVAAQTVTAAPLHPLQALWDAIYGLQARFDDFKNNFDLFVNDYTMFHETTTNQLSKTDQSISELHATDENLQTQIDAVATAPFVIDRTKIYERFAQTNSDSVYCNSVEDILLTGYCSTGPFKENVEVTTAVADSFSDLDIIVNPTWTITLGNFVVGTSPAGALKLVAIGSGLHDIYTPSTFTSIPVSMETKVMPNRTNDQLYIGLTDSPGPILQSNDSGYMLGALRNFNGSDSLVFYRMDQGTFVYLFIVPNIALPTGVEQKIRAERDSAGYWTLFYNDVPFPTGVQDTTYQSFYYTHLRYNSNNNGGSFDDISVTYGIPGPADSAFENINNPLLPMGIKCAVNGSARIMCIDQ